ncbi:unnamed protein product [Periconia digitata]|uniref:Uncharacterized protein n=1 Tax=Periconia digitata TaxID=1303443 RepID=A0A9W4XDZ8_9PLEO|nr:unnamed protein product [Periconia digitata]
MSPTKTITMSVTTTNTKHHQPPLSQINTLTHPKPHPPTTYINPPQKNPQRKKDHLIKSHTKSRIQTKPSQNKIRTQAILKSPAICHSYYTI